MHESMYVSEKFPLPEKDGKFFFAGDLFLGLALFENQLSKSPKYLLKTDGIH